MSETKRRNKIIEFLFKDRTTSKERSLIFENFGEMLYTNIDTSTAIKILKNEMSSKGALNLIEGFESDVDSGLPVWKSISKSNLLKGNYLSIVRIGEESGKLAENLHIVINQIRKDRELKSRIQSASTYPIFVLIIMIGVSFAIATQVLPRLAVVYKSLKVDLPWITNALISIGDFIGNYGNIAIPAFIIVIVAIFYLLFVFSKTKFIGQKLLLNTPVAKRIIVESEVARFGMLLGTLLKSGFPIIESLKLLESSTGFLEYKKLYRHLQSEIDQGLPFKDAFYNFKNVKKLLPAYVRQLIISGQQTGTLAQSLITIGETYDKKNETSTKDLSVLLEPVLLVVIWLGVAFIAFAVILPIYSLVGNITDLSVQRTVEDDTTLVQEESTEIQQPIDETTNIEESTPEVKGIETNRLPHVEYLKTSFERQDIPVFDQLYGNIVGYAQRNTEYQYIEFNEGWYKITLSNGVEGWLDSVYVISVY